MANKVKVPPIIEFMFPILEALRDYGGSARKYEVVEAVERIMHLTKKQREATYPDSDVRKVYARIGTAYQYLKSYDATESRGFGHWAITGFGNTFTDEDTFWLWWEGEDDGDESDSDQIAEDSDEHSEVLEDDEESTEPTESIRERLIDELIPVFEEEIVYSEDNWADELLTRIRELSPTAFEHLTKELLRAEGFRDVEVTKRSWDGGIDGEGVFSSALIEIPVFFQSKRHKNSISAKDLQAFRGALNARNASGVFVTTSSFTRGAKKEADHENARPIRLIDGNTICTLMLKHKFGIKRDVHYIEITTEIDEAWFAHYDEQYPT